MKKNNYDIIREAIFSERTTALAEKQRTYTFRVPRSANKLEIKQAVEQAFHVQVDSVRTINVKPKIKTDRYRGLNGQTRRFKKAMVKLAKGHEIQFV
ncbi:MAG: 50S ribosomal protein L23 [Candidatus Hinthialibacter sp.]